MFKSHNRAGRRCQSQELDLTIFMSLLVVLVPMLLITAEFAKITIIDFTLPHNGADPSNKSAIKSADTLLQLTTIVSDSTFTVAAQGGFLPSITYREFHHYVAEDDQYAFTVERGLDSNVFHPLTQRVMEKQELRNRNLYATDAKRTIIKSFYTKHNELLVDAKNNPAKSLALGDTLYTATMPSRIVVVKSKEMVDKRPLNAYDLLRCTLLKVKVKYGMLSDGNRITIASESQVAYDKIVQIMDVAQEANFTDLGIAKLRNS